MLQKMGSTRLRKHLSFWNKNEWLGFMKVSKKTYHNLGISFDKNIL